MKVAVFVDISNLYYCVNNRFQGRRVDFVKYLTKALGDGILYRAIAYGAHSDNEADRFIRLLTDFGYEPKYKQLKQYDNSAVTNIDLEPLNVIINQLEPNCELQKDGRTTLDKVSKLVKANNIRRKADWDVGMAMDIVRLAPRVDTIVLGTADGDLAPALAWASEQGCRCVVFAAGISKELRDLAHQSIEIDASVLGELSHD